MSPHSPLRRILPSLGLLVGLFWAHPANAYYCGQFPMAIESLICSQPELMALDDDMAKAYHSAVEARTPEDKPRLEAEQRRWSAGRWEACGAVGAHASAAERQAAQECLRTNYQERMAALSNWHPPQWASSNFTLPVLPDPINPESILTAMFGPKGKEEDGGGHPWIIYGSGTDSLAGLDSRVSAALIHRFVKDGTDHYLLMTKADIRGGGHHTPAPIGGAVYRRAGQQWHPVNGERVVTLSGHYGQGPSMDVKMFGRVPLVSIAIGDNFSGGESMNYQYLSFTNGNLAEVLLLQDEFIDSEVPDGNRHCRRIEHDLKVLDEDHNSLPDLLITTSFSEESGFTEERGYCEMTSKPGRRFWRDKTRLIYGGTAYCAPRPGKDAHLPVCSKKD